VSVSTLNVAALAALERALNAALALAPATRDELAGLSGKVFGVRVSVPALSVFIAPDDAGVRLLAYHEGTNACTVSGAGSDFVALAGAADKAAALVNGNLRIEGDSSALIALARLLAGIEIDWERHLALLIGDVPAHQLGRAVRASARWGRDAHAALLRHAGEFMHEEARLAPSRAETDDFITDVQTLAQRAARVENTLRRIGRRIDALAAQRPPLGG